VRRCTRTRWGDGPEHAGDGTSGRRVGGAHGRPGEPGRLGRRGTHRAHGDDRPVGGVVPVLERPRRLGDHEIRPPAARCRPVSASPSTTSSPPPAPARGNGGSPGAKAEPARLPWRSGSTSCSPGGEHPHRRADGRPWPHKIHELSSGAAIVAKVFEIDDLLIAVTSAITGARGVAITRRYAALGGGRIVSRRSIRVATSPARVPERAPTAGWKDTIALSRLRPSFSARSSLAAASTAAMFVANVHHVVKMVLPIVGGSTPD